MAKDENSLRKTIIGSVASALIAAAILYFVPSVWDTVKALLVWVWSALTFSISLPVWSLILIGLATLPTVSATYNALTKDAPKSWRDYTKDEFHGMVWRWRYSARGTSHGVWCFCPHDDTFLVYSTSPGYTDPKIAFQCETCGCSFGPFDGEKEFFLASIERQIDRKIRTDEWRRVVEAE